MIHLRDIADNNEAPKSNLDFGFREYPSSLA